MESPFLPLRNLDRLRLLAASAVLAWLSILTGYAHGTGSRCDAFLAKAFQFRVAGDNAACVRWASSGEPQCRAEGIVPAFRMTLLKAEAQIDLGLYPEAWKTLEPEPTGNAASSRVGRRLKDQAWVELYRENYAHAGQLLDEAEKRERSAAIVDQAAISEIVIAKLTLFGKTGDLEAARKTVEDLDRAAGIVDKAHLLAAYGYVLQRSARYEQAASYYESALAEKGVSALDAARFQNNLAGIYYHLGDLEQARNAALQAEAVLANGGDVSGLRICLNTLGLIEKDRADFGPAKDYLDRALKIAERLQEKTAVAEGRNNLAALAIESQNGGAEQLLAKQNDTDDRESRQYTQLAGARILAGRQAFAGALALLNELRTHAFVNPNLRIEAEVEYIDIYRQMHREAGARAHYRTARELVDSVRAAMRKDENKLAWFDAQNELNQKWVRFLVEARHPAEALEAAEASRARLMMERLGRHAQVNARVSEYRTLAGPRGAALVYWLMPEVSYVWVVTPAGIDMRELPGEYRLAAMVGRYQSFIEDGNDPLASNNTAGEELEAAILKPVLPLLRGVDRVVLVPDAQLNALNFETLPVDGRYWLESVTISVTPTLNILNGSAAGAHSAAPRSILAVADPEPTAEFGKLPNAARELDSVAAAFPASTVLRGSGATPAAYLQAAADSGYIHFAAHASAVAQHPLESAVVLSSGRLTARELLRHPIHAELVTISACRSAGIRSYHGEGLVGLAWVFLQTGAHGVIAGLWDASDDAAADLMSGLYRRISHGEEPAPALREAKLEMRMKNPRFASPYYWGAFQYYRGSGR